MPRWPTAAQNLYTYCTEVPRAHAHLAQKINTLASSVQVSGGIHQFASEVEAQHLIKPESAAINAHRPWFGAIGPQGCISYSPSSSSNSPSSSAVASWYCWYSETRSFILLSASVNSISSMPSPVYQCKNALRLNIAVKYSATRLNISWMAVLLPKKLTAIFSPFGGMSQIELLMLFGIHSTK